MAPRGKTRPALQAQPMPMQRRPAPRTPPVDSPLIFGLHPNADLTYRLKGAAEMIATIVETQPEDNGGGSGKSVDGTVKEQSLELLSKMSPDYVEEIFRAQIAKLKGPPATPGKGFSVPLNISLLAWALEQRPVTAAQTPGSTRPELLRPARLAQPEPEQQRLAPSPARAQWARRREPALQEPEECRQSALPALAPLGEPPSAAGRGGLHGPMRTPTTRSRTWLKSALKEPPMAIEWRRSRAAT